MKTDFHHVLTIAGLSLVLAVASCGKPGAGEPAEGRGAESPRPRRGAAADAARTGRRARAVGPRPPGRGAVPP